MSFIDMSNLNLDDAVELSAVEPGEYKIRITSVKTGTNKNGHPYLMPTFSIEGEAAAKPFTRYYGLPTPDMEEKKLNNTKLALKRFEDAFDIKLSNVQSENDLIGCCAWAILGVEESEEYGTQNTLKRLVKGA